MDPSQPNDHQQQPPVAAPPTGQPPVTAPYAQQTVPYPAPSQPTDPAARARVNKLKFRWGLIALIGPTALLIITLTAYAVINFALSTNTTSTMDSSTMFASTAPITTVVNIILFVVSAVVVLTWLPGIIAGIVLLATRKR